MKRINTQLCIGGPFDGQRKSPPHWDQNNLCLLVPPPVGIANIACDNFNITAYIYRRQCLGATDTVFDVWILDGMTLQDAMARLLANYRPEPAVTP